MKKGVRWAVAFLLLCAASARAEKLRNHFDFDAETREPAFFDFLVLGVRADAQWRVLTDLNPPSPPHVATQVLLSRPAGSIAVAVRRNSHFRDGTWSVALKRGQGQGGIALRIAGEKDYLVLLVDLATGEARLISSRNGSPVELAKGRAEPQGEWEVLSITADGPKISAQRQGKPFLEATDPNPQAGRAGMATAGPVMVSFDEFVLDPAQQSADARQ